MSLERLIDKRMSKGEIDGLLDRLAERLIDFGADQNEVERSFAGALFRLKANYYRNSK